MNELQERVEKISCMAFDVDGTLTDGHIYISEKGELFKAFDAKDGLGIVLAGRLGYKTALITGRHSHMTGFRASELGIDAVYQDVADKTAALRDICQKFSIEAENIAYMGDDLNDLSALRLAGLPCAPGDAALDVKNAARFVAASNGGRGAAREMIEFIMKAQDKWQKAIELML